MDPDVLITCHSETKKGFHMRIHGKRNIDPNKKSYTLDIDLDNCDERLRITFPKSAGKMEIFTALDQAFHLMEMNGHFEKFFP